MNTPDPLPETDELADKRARLRELTSQSRNLELVISGAALFATLSVASGLDDALLYYRYNLMTDTDLIHDILPVQIVSLCKAACYVLFGPFLINFVVRAFWVSLVGLLAAYPDGIRFERIAMLSQTGAGNWRLSYTPRSILTVLGNSCTASPFCTSCSTSSGRTHGPGVAGPAS